MILCALLKIQKIVKKILEAAKSMAGIPYLCGGGDTNGPTYGMVQDGNDHCDDTKVKGI